MTLVHLIYSLLMEIMEITARIQTQTIMWLLKNQQVNKSLVVVLLSTEEVLARGEAIK